MTSFYPLLVSELRHDTRDAVVVTLKPRDEDRERFKFIAGQYLTFRQVIDGGELRRCYSICSGVDDGVLRIGIKKVDGGLFSTWANELLGVGDVLEVMPPMGTFHMPLDPTATRHYLALAGGSGITPVLSVIKTALAREPGARVTLVYANRSPASIMFREELEDLKSLNLGRLAVLHILEGEANDIELFSGQLDRTKCDALFDNWIDVKAVDAAFICGPEPMMLSAAAALRERGLKEDRIKFELFASPRKDGVRNRAAQVQETSKGGDCEVTVVLDGLSRSFVMPRRGTSLLEAVLANKIDAPYACRAGVCSTCRALVVEGGAEMQVNHALEDYEVRRGYVLTCQCYPLSDRMVVSYDE